MFVVVNAVYISADRRAVLPENVSVYADLADCRLGGVGNLIIFVEGKKCLSFGRQGKRNDPVFFLYFLRSCAEITNILRATDRADLRQRCSPAAIMASQRMLLRMIGIG